MCLREWNHESKDLGAGLMKARYKVLAGVIVCALVGGALRFVEAFDPSRADASGAASRGGLTGGINPVAGINGQAITPSSVQTDYALIGTLDAGYVLTATVDAGSVWTAYAGISILDAGTVQATSLVQTPYDLVGTLDAGYIMTLNIDAGTVLSNFAALGSVDAGTITVQGDATVATGKRICLDGTTCSFNIADTSSVVVITGTNSKFSGNVILNADLQANTNNATDIGTSVKGMRNLYLAHNGTTQVGTKVLSGGTGTVTVYLSGAICVCSNTTTALACMPSVSGTTLTVTSGVGTDTVSYWCI